MALTKIDYEALHELHVPDPVTGEECGAVILVRSTSSAAVKAVQKRQMVRAASRKGRPMAPQAEADQAIKEAEDLAAACIADWDWNGAGFETASGDVDPDYSEKAAVDAVRVDWFYACVMEAAAKVANFIAT